ncbi:HAD family hydrolase [Actinoplanes sp. NPDC049596]|uniref:HAD family hydrolase n=1 Tax=unclassified Actinoplanes TaxID=2626549 RepID=UPI00342E333C
MPLLLLDLDNTLIDRDAAFRAAVTAFLAGHGLPAADVDWVMTVDGGGFVPRDEVATTLTQRYGVDARPLLDTGAADCVVLEPPVARALTDARARGWTSVIVTNGRTAQQEAKIRRTGLDRLVHGWVVSEAAGCRKPEPEIFHAAAATAGLPLAGAWMIGDSPRADIAGAAALGLRTVWVANGRAWSLAGCAPTYTASDVTSAVRLVV